MTLSELKKQITDNSFCSDKIMIFKCVENNFVADQYIKAIAKLRNREIEFVQNIDALLTESEDIFEVASLNPILTVLKCEELSSMDSRISQLTNTIIVTKTITKESLSFYKDYIIEIPKLLDWQIKDYLYSNLTGIDKSKLDWIQTACKGDIYKISNEVALFHSFSEQEQKFLFDDLLSNGMFSDITNFNIFNLTNALSERDVETVKTLYQQKEVMGISDMALLSLVCQNFRNMILIHLNPNPTSENTGLSDKQIYAIRKKRLNYNKEELYLIYKNLSDIDRKIKSGEFPVDILFDYILINILGV